MAAGLAISICLPIAPVYAEPPPADQRAKRGTALLDISLPPEIVVTGRRNVDKYRLPPEFRNVKSETVHRRTGFDPRLACREVGPRGCGIDPLPILKVSSDGAMQWGAPKEPQ